ncbi:MAG TPA: FAD-binding protein [Gaiellales bacterium]|jgi:UDP-N-acetylenolpyruvoylglucosamine reductase|nr:FAD-binding protein [Gaiellales bacterium]
MEGISRAASRPLDVSILRDRMSGEVVLPGEAGWDAARTPWNLAVEQRPEAVALPHTAADVASVVNFAATNDVRVAVQGTGHGAAAMGPLDGAILMKTEQMRGIEVDADRRRTRVEAGVLWAEVAAAAGAHGLAALAGSSPDVGVVGYTLGGGLSWLARRYGLASSSVLAVELVTADGRARRVDASTDPELFWALRGGGGSFGAVTAMEFALHPVRSAYAGMLLWPIDRAGEVLSAWLEWTQGMPDDMTTVGRVLQLPPLPDIPEPFRGCAFAVIEAFHLGGEAAGAALLAPMRALRPEIDTVTTIPAPALSQVHMDPEHPVPGRGDGLLLADLSQAGIDALLAAAGPRSGSALLSVEIRQLGGALARPAPGAGALSHIDAAYAVYAVGIAATAEMGAAVERSVDAVRGALAPWEADTAYLNTSERRTSGDRLFGEYTHHRLRAVKAAYDAGDLFRANHPLAPAS